jgi:RNA polymerase sigma factor (sigma-70 family)
MIMNGKMTTGEHSDAELVSRSLSGDRDAFSRIVVRYQNLICSLAYSRMGNLGQSEDVAQETFITAWRHLRHLREPDKLRAWLCGIVRNRIRKSREREGTEPVHNAATLEEAPDSPAIEALPSEETISREEAAILWRALERIPELYREPLVLFYRENKSIAHVAGALEISEDAVKQRLLRGRKLLQEEVQAFVENTLRRSAPGQAFSSAVLAVLPLAAGPAATAGIGAGAKGAAAAKSGFLAVWLAPLAPFVGILAGFASQWVLIRAGATARERRAKRIELIVVWILVLGFCVGGQYAVGSMGRHFAWNERVFFAAMSVFWWLFAMIMAAWIVVCFRRSQAGGRSAEVTGEILAPAAKAMQAGTLAGVVAGTQLMMFSSVISLACRAHDWMTAGIIAGIMAALGVWHFFHSRGKTGVPASRAYLQQVGLCSAVLLAIFDLRFDVWLATNYGVTLAEIHSRFPMWLVPLLTLAVGVWTGVLLGLTKPRSRLE